MRRFGSIIAFLLAGSSAFAADLDVKAPVPAPVIQAVNWTGFYIGGNLGGVVAHASGTSDFTDTTGGSIAPSNPQTNAFSQGGFLGGVCKGASTGNSVRSGSPGWRPIGTGPTRNILSVVKRIPTARLAATMETVSRRLAARPSGWRRFAAVSAWRGKIGCFMPPAARRSGAFGLI